MMLIIGIIAAIVFADQLTKWLAVIYLEGEASFPLWKNVLHFTYVENEGAAFGMLKDARWIFMFFSAAAIVVILVYLYKARPKSRVLKAALAMIVGGGIGNMIDRTVLGYVVDFIDFTLIDFAVFNVADSFVCIGSGLLILYLILDMVNEKKRTAKEPEEDSHGTVE